MRGETRDDRRILVIDDQPLIHDAYRTILDIERASASALDALEMSLFGELCEPHAKRESFRLEFAHQGKEGFQKTQQAVAEGRPFALAFVDMRMPPGWDGLETIENLWKASPDLQVVVCTAYSDHSWEDIGRRLGRSDQLLLLKKPFANEEVYQLAVALTEKWRLAKNLKSQIEFLKATNCLMEIEIDRRRLVEDRLLHLTHFDPLTNLPNRLALVERLDSLLARTTPNTATFNAILFLDIDNFKLINDSLGHSEGDRLLQQLGQRLLLQVKCDKATNLPNHVVMSSRLGGDEFVVLLQNLHSLEQAVAVADQLHNLLQAPFKLGGREVVVSCSIGIAIIDEANKSAELSLRNADTAMYAAKSGGKNRSATFDEEMHSSIVAKLEIVDSLRKAIKDQKFELHYQPIVDLKEMRTIGFEALVRWRGEDGKLIPPNVFIGLAEETGLIVPLGEWIFEEACETLVEMNQSLEPAEHVSMSINVSKRQFMDPAFVEFVSDALHKTGAPGSLIHVEITESVVMENPINIVDKLFQIHSLGVKIYMDDFGTGHSSLSCLHQFPIDVLKIDRAFISRIGCHDGITAITDAIIIMAHKLGHRVVAEGIETVDQLDQLVDMGCDYGQGYYFSRPMPKSLIRLPASFSQGKAVSNPCEFSVRQTHVGFSNS